MSQLRDAADAFFETEYRTPAPGTREAGGPDPAPVPEATPAGTDPPETPADPTPDPALALAPAAPSAPSPAATPAPPDAAALDDLKAIKDRYASDHPDMGPVLDAALREMQRGLQRKFDAVAALKREAADTHVRDQQLAGIPPEDLQRMAHWYQLARTNPQAAADQLFEDSERLRQAAGGYQSAPGGYAPAPYPNPSPPDLSTALQQTPEWQQLQRLTYQQNVQAITTQIESQFVALAPEFGNQAIPENQRREVLATIQQRGLGLEDIPLLWRGLFGQDYARSQALRKGQATQQAKAGLTVTGSGAPAPGGPGPEKALSTREAVMAVCDKHGIR